MHRNQLQRLRYAGILAVPALLLSAVTACAPSQAAPNAGTPTSAPATSAPAPSASATSAAAATSSAPATGRKWASTKQFMEIKSGLTRGGKVYLLARPAKKEILGESFDTVTIPGPFTEVEVVSTARILLLDGESGLPEVFVEDLAKRKATQVDEGFDLTFDGQGRVIQVDWLYVP